MVSITLSVPADVKHEMENFPEMNWSGFIRKCLAEKTAELSWKEEMLQKLKAEEKFDPLALELGRKIKESMWKKYKQKGW